MVERKTAEAKPRPVKVGKNDIFMSIKPEHIQNIATGAKNHEYRRYLLPSTVRRIWFYTTAPVSRLEYVARVSHGKVRGEVPEDGGIGNADFNAGKKVSKYAYEILDLWKLKEPIGLKLAISRGVLRGPPQKYCWVPLAFLQSCPVDKQDHVIARVPEECSIKGRKEQEFDKENVDKENGDRVGKVQLISVEEPKTGKHQEQGLDQENVGKKRAAKPLISKERRKISTYFAPSNR